VRLMRGNSNLLVLVVALVLGIVAAVLARNWLASHAKLAQANVGTIVVAASPLTFGTQLTAANTAEIPWNASVLPQGSFATKAALLKDGRRMALALIAQNEPILRSKITAPNQPATLSSMLSPGKRAVTVRVDDVRGVAGFIQPGDLVDVVLIQTETGPRSNNSYSEVILQSAKVLAIDQVTGERTDKPTVAKAVTLEVSIEDAEKILLATNIGHLSLVLRQPSEGHITAVRRVTSSDLDGVPAHPVSAVPPPPIVAQAPPKAVTPSEDTRRITIWHGMRKQDYDPPVYVVNR
jgi:pilus assembly protein CpaB